MGRASELAARNTSEFIENSPNAVSHNLGGSEQKADHSEGEPVDKILILATVEASTHSCIGPQGEELVSIPR